jgi:gamma-glutamyltranspeptidase/glutathione hydrolase
MSRQQHKAGVAAGHRATAEAARTVLTEGGNAFDAAIAGFLAACVAEPVLASLGGGGFLVAKTADGDVNVFDFFTDTPLQRPEPGDVDFFPVHADFGATQQEFHIGMGSVATPGAVAGIYAVHKALGRMPVSVLAEPAKMLARTGITLNPFQAYLLDVVGPIYRASPTARAQFCKDGEDALLGPGDQYLPGDFAAFLDALTAAGPRWFYEGEIAERIAGMDGSTINAADLGHYSVERRRPLCAQIAGHDVFLNPPPAIGGALIAHMLRSLDASGLRQEDFARAVHIRALVGAMDGCNRARAASGIDADAVAGAATLAGMAVHPPAYRGTTHISVADADGNLAALTVSNGEGCGHVVPGTGIMLNNMLGEEDLNANGFFAWPEGVRMSSMMTPGVMSGPDGTWTALGSGGSNRIRTALTQTISNICLFGRSISDAVRHPRLHLEAGKLSLEPGIEPADTGWQGDLQVWPEANMFFGGAHVIARTTDGGVSGTGDPRRDGIYLGI